MTTVSLPASFLSGEGGSDSKKKKKKGGVFDPPRETYFQRKHHSPEAYSRIENWLPDVKSQTFSTHICRLTRGQADAIIKYRDETKLRAAMRKMVADEKGLGPIPEPLTDPAFLDEMADFIRSDWAKSPSAEVRGWQASLVAVESVLDAAVRNIGKGKGAFVKLSIRSPKDAALHTSSTREAIRQALASSVHTLPKDGKSTPDMVLEDLKIVSSACQDTLRARDGAAALRLLLESDRAHTDLMNHILYLEDGEKFNLCLAVREWDDRLDPDFEFRLFVVGGQPTALTQYNDFVFDKRMVKGKKAIERSIMGMWDRVKAKIHKKSKDYCIDFAVQPDDFSKALIIEVNNFQPPLAGSGMFEYADEGDRKLLQQGPFSFRIRESPLESHEIMTQAGIRTLHEPILDLIRTERMKKINPSSNRLFTSCTVS